MRKWLVLAILAEGVARGAAPSYSAESIVNGANFAPGPVAPNSIVAIFGTDLSFVEAGLTADNTHSHFLPDNLGNVRVYIANFPAPLIYVCGTQINFLVPGDMKPGEVPVRVVRQGVTGPPVMITLVDASPEVFMTPDFYVIAQHAADYSLVDPDHPAHAGEVIVMYATGLGRTEPNPAPGEIPWYAGLITRMSDLRVLVGGTALPSERILYAGLTPGWAGLYQINLILPDTLEADPWIRVAIGAQVSPAELRLAATATQVQPSLTEKR